MSRLNGRRLWTDSAVIVLVLGIAAALCYARLSDPRRISSSGDSYWYMRQAQMFTGVTPAEASAVASRLVCDDINRSRRASNKVPDCVTYDQSKVAERYIKIFTTRPGYPWFASLLIPRYGVWNGMLAATVLLAMLAALLSYFTVRLAVGSRFAGVVASALLMLFPCGFWMTRMLAEGATAVGYLGVLLGATLVWRARAVSGIAISVLALGWLFTARSANGMALTLALLTAAVAMLITRYPHPARALITGGIGGVGLLAWVITSSRLHLPGLNETIQDFATYHFKIPDIPNPYEWLYEKNLWFWPLQWRDIRASPWGIFAFLFAIVVLFRRLRQEAWLWIISATTGLWLLVAHPAYGEYDRLMQPLWITAACAFGWAAALAVARQPRPERPGPAAEPAPAGPPHPGRDGDPGRDGEPVDDKRAPAGS